MIRDTFDRFREPDRGRFGDNEQVRGNDSARSDLADIDVVIHFGRPKAILVSLDGKRANTQWLARSMIEIEHKSQVVMGENRDGQLVEMATATVTLPRWLAEKAGLI